VIACAFRCWTSNSACGCWRDTPGLTIVASLAIGVAIGLGSLYFEATQRLLNPSIPLDEGDRLVLIQNWESWRLRKTRSLYTRWRWGAPIFGSLEQLETPRPGLGAQTSWAGSQQAFLLLMRRRSSMELPGGSVPIARRRFDRPVLASLIVWSVSLMTLLLSAVGIMLTAGLLACASPLRRALRVDLTEALRREG
jgi:ABC-type antimicrobial peptide transport system permease subunit